MKYKTYTQKHKYIYLLVGPWIPEINLTWTKCIILLIYFWIWFTAIFFRALYLYPLVRLADNFPFSNHLFKFRCPSYVNFIKWVGRCTFFLHFLEQLWKTGSFLPLMSDRTWKLTMKLFCLTVGVCVGVCVYTCTCKCSTYRTIHMFCFFLRPFW